MYRPVAAGLALLIVPFIRDIGRASPAHRESSDARALEWIARGRQSIGPIASLTTLSAIGTRQSTTESAPGTERPVEIHFALPDKFLRTVSTVVPETNEIRLFVWGVNGTTLLTGVRGLPPGSKSSTAGDPSVERRAFWRVLLGWFLLQPPSVDFSYSYAGEARAPDGTQASLVDVTGPEDFAARLFLESKTGRPLMMTYGADSPMAPAPIVGANGRQTIHPAAPPDRRVTMATYFSDVRPAGAFRLPYLTIDSQAGQTVRQLRVTKFVINPELKPALFVRPS